MISWLFPPKRSPSDSFPPGPSKTYFFSTFSQGSSRRSRLNWSRSRVNSFSFIKSSLRAASHSACDTILGRSTLLFIAAFASMVLSFGYIFRVSYFRAGLDAKFFPHERGQSARRDQASGHQHCAADAKWTHTFLRRRDDVHRLAVHRERNAS